MNHPPSQERRRVHRFEMAVPVMLNTPQGDLLTESRNISTRGMFVRSPAALSIGAKVQMTYSGPKQNVLQENARFHCEGTVVRVEPMPDGFGIAIAWHGPSLYR